MHPAKIVNVTHKGVRLTMDIEIDSDTHIFYGNGIATSNSHAVSYAMNSYLTAYAKSHFPRAFFCSYLYYSHQKQKPHLEIKQLVRNARLMNIDVLAPKFNLGNAHFSIIDKNIYFGVGDIKGLGDSIVKRIQERRLGAVEELGRKVEDWTWVDFLIGFSQYVPSTAIKNMVSVGALDYPGISRTRMLYEYDIYSQLSDREQKIVLKRHVDKPYRSVGALLEQITKEETGRDGVISNKSRLKKVKGFLESYKHPSHTMDDSPGWIANIEEKLLGISLTYSSVDECDISAANCNCKEFANGYNGVGGLVMIACKIDSVKETVTKKGKNPGQEMAFISISDIEGCCEGVVFPDIWDQYSGLMVEDNTLMISGKRGREKNSLIVERAWQL